MSSLLSGRIRGVVGQFLRAPRVSANVPSSRLCLPPLQPLCNAAFNPNHTNQRGFCTSLVGTHRSEREYQLRTNRSFSSQANIVEEEEDEIDMNRDPLFVHVYPGSRVLEMALPYDAMKMNQIDAMIRSTQPVMQGQGQGQGQHQSLSVEGCNVLSPALVTSLQAQLEGLCTNASVRTITISTRTFLSFNTPCQHSFYQHQHTLPTHLVSTCINTLLNHMSRVPTYTPCP